MERFRWSKNTIKQNCVLFFYIFFFISLRGNTKNRGKLFLLCDKLLAKMPSDIQVSDLSEKAENSYRVQ